MHNYSFRTENKFRDDGACKDALLEYIGRAIEVRKLRTEDIQNIEPGISKMMVSRLRTGDRSACSKDRLQRIARALGMTDSFCGAAA